MVVNIAVASEFDLNYVPSKEQFPQQSDFTIAKTC